MDLKYDIKVYDNGYSEITKFEEISQFSKLIQTEQLIRSICANSVNTIKTPILPPNTFFFSSSSDRMRVLFTIPEQLIYLPFCHYSREEDETEHCSIRRYNLFDYSIFAERGEHYELDPDEYTEGYYYEEIEVGINAIKPLLLPNLFVDVVLMVSEGQLVIQAPYIYSYKDPILMPSTQLYKFPYGNQYADYRMCTGSFEFYKLTKLDKVDVYDLRSLYTQIRNFVVYSITNGDLDYNVKNIKAVFELQPKLILNTMINDAKDLSETLIKAKEEMLQVMPFIRHTPIDGIKFNINNALMIVRKYFGHEDDNYNMLLKSNNISQIREFVYNNLQATGTNVSQLMV